MGEGAVGGEDCAEDGEGERGGGEVAVELAEGDERAGGGDAADDGREGDRRAAEAIEGFRVVRRVLEEANRYGVAASVLITLDGSGTTNPSKVYWEIMVSSRATSTK